MKASKYIIGLLAISLSVSAFAQLVPNGSFENGTLPAYSQSIPPQILDPVAALPNWTISGSPLYYQDILLGGSVIALQGQPSASHGTNSVYLQAGFGGATTPVAIWQTLSVPLNVNSITFQSKQLCDDSQYIPGYCLPLLISAAGLQVTPTILSTNSSGYNTYAIDVTAYSGALMDLMFSLDPMENPGRGGAFQIDNIRYSTAIVPEPGTFTLFGIGVAVGWLMFVRNRTCLYVRKS